MPLLVVGFMSAAGHPGAPHLFIAALVTAVLVRVFAATHRHCAIVFAVVTVATVTGAVAGLAMFVHPPMQRIHGREACLLVSAHARADVGVLRPNPAASPVRLPDAIVLPQ